MDSKELKLSVWNEKHLRFAIEGAGVALWAWNVDTDKLLLDQRSYDMWGVPNDKNVTFEDLRGVASGEVAVASLQPGADKGRCATVLLAANARQVGRAARRERVGESPHDRSISESEHA